MLLAGGEPDRFPAPQPSVDHSQVTDHAAVDVVVGVEDRAGRFIVEPPCGRRDLVDDPFQQLVDPSPVLADTRMTSSEEPPRTPASSAAALSGSAAGGRSC